MIFVARRHLLWMLTATALVGCEDRSADISGPSLALSRADAGHLAELRRIGEGCAVMSRDPSGVVRAIALSRNQLPFEMPAIRRDAGTGRGHGRIAHVVISERDAKPVSLSCWVPDNLTEQEIAHAVGSSHGERGTKEKWEGVLAKLEGAPELPDTTKRSPLSAAARAFMMEMLSDSTNSGTRPRGSMLTSLFRTQAVATMSPPPVRQDFESGCGWGWTSFYYAMDS